MKKTICVLLVSMLALCAVCAYAEGSNKQNDWWSGGFTMPEMPEMPTIDTSNWGSMEMPEGWGNISMDGFGKPLNGDSWGSMGMDSDWAKQFEDMKKQSGIDFNKNLDNGVSDNWPPQSFKDLESAFNDQKKDVNITKPETKDIQSTFSEMFGNIETPKMDVPEIDTGALKLPDMNVPNNAFIGSVSGVANMNSVRYILSGAGSNMNTSLSFGSLGSLPNAAFSIQEQNMKGAYQTIKGSLTPQTDWTKKYDGSLYKLPAK